MGINQGIARISRLAAEVAAETLWPTRCAICDMPGSVLCGRCVRELSYLDWWRACRRCGSPFGFVQCDFCTPSNFDRLGLDELPFDGCASAVHFTGDTGQLVRVFKDQGEQRLAGSMADIMRRAMPLGWNVDAVSFIPATLPALRYRGYDHAELLARALSDRLGVECICALDRPRTRDQRRLGAAERIANLAGAFASKGRNLEGTRLLLVDDVFTTGATLCAASQALRSSGAAEVYCQTFARV